MIECCLGEVLLVPLCHHGQCKDVRMGFTVLLTHIICFWKFLSARNLGLDVAFIQIEMDRDRQTGRKGFNIGFGLESFIAVGVRVLKFGKKCCEWWEWLWGRWVF